MRCANHRAMARLACMAFLSGAAHATPVDTATEVLRQSGIQGGVVLHVGVGTGELTLALRRSDAFLVHGLDHDAERVAAARKRIVRTGQHGPVTVEHWTRDTLPFIDNLVNLVVVEDAGPVPMTEVQRVLCPSGVAMVRTGAKWKKTVKPRPVDIDEWTHFLRDASNNAVAKDKRVGPPRHLQWKSGPMFTRDHDSLASVSAVTTSNGRLFYIIDEGPISLIHRPPEWRLVARDAFNGKLLWKRDIPEWITQLANFRAGPAQMPRRLVSVGDSVFVTLGLDAPVEMLDAASGRTLHRFAGSEGTEEILVHDGTLLAVLGDPNVLTDAVSKVEGFWQIEARDVPPVKRKVVAYDIEAGKEVWRADDDQTAGYTGLSLTAYGNRAFYLDGERLQCRELASGKELWASEFAFKGKFLLNYTPTVVAHDDVILCLTYDRLWAFSVSNGGKLWETKGAVGFGAAGDLFVINDLVWTLPMIRFGAKTVWGRADFLGSNGTESWGMDLHTGAVKRRVKRNILPGVHHHRCYRNKATEDFVVYGQGGLEFMDLDGEEHSGNLWTRGICQYGVMPANGYTYVPPHPCQCFSQEMLHGFYVLSASNSTQGIIQNPWVEQGPAFFDSVTENAGVTVPPRSDQQVWQPPVRNERQDEWPMYRADITRSGSSSVAIAGELGQVWQANLGGDLTAAVVAANRMFACSKAEQILYCLDAGTGRVLWQLATPGKVDSPPTIVDGLCVFGSVDGSVTCLRAADGVLRWRFRIRKEERRTVVDDRFESIWPIHGSVLVQKGIVYFGAGRSSHLDGGIHVYALDLATGELRNRIAFRGDGEGSQKALLNADALVSDGVLINMGLAQFDGELTVNEESHLKTLICDTGFLADAWFHRENWALGGVRGSVAQSGRTTMQTQSRHNATSLGKLLVFNDTTAYGIKTPYSWQKYANRYPTHTGHVHQKYTRYSPEWFPVGSRVFSFTNAAARPAEPSGDKAAKRRRRGPSREGTRNETWGVDMPYQLRAITLAANTLAVAGWLDAIAIQPKTGLPIAPGHHAPRRCVLRTLSAEDGAMISEHKIPSEPAYDGMAIAYGRIYLPLKDGTVLCFGNKGR